MEDGMNVHGKDPYLTILAYLEGSPESTNEPAVWH